MNRKRTMKWTKTAKRSGRPTKSTRQIPATTKCSSAADPAPRAGDAAPAHHPQPAHPQAHPGPGHPPPNRGWSASQKGKLDEHLHRSRVLGQYVPVHDNTVESVRLAHGSNLILPCQFNVHIKCRDVCSSLVAHLAAVSASRVRIPASCQILYIL